MLSKKRIKSLSNHVLLFLLFVFYETRVAIIKGTNANVMDFVVIYSYDIIFFSITAFFIVPKIYSLYDNIPYKMLIVCVWIFITTLIAMLIGYTLRWTHGEPIQLEGFIDEFIISSFRRSFIGAIAYFYGDNKFKRDIQKKSYEKDIIILKEKDRVNQLELSLLRAQFDPHFMFNSLTGIYKQIALNPSNAGETVLKLCDLFEFSLDRDKDSRLQDEIEHINRLLDLYRTLHDGCIYVDLTVLISDEMLKKSFPAKLLINPIENIFKHAITDDPDFPVNIEITEMGKNIVFVIQNKMRPRETTYKSLGYGMTNLRKNLDQYFPGLHDLSETKSDQFYGLKLILEI